MLIYLIPFALQGLAILFDEFYFHHKRRLPKWEVWGHPLDTTTVLICFLFLVYFPPSQTNILVFAGLSFFSSLFVTKDEFVHSEKCEPAENWLHAILFILHPIVFLSAGLIWYFNLDMQVIYGQIAILVAFLIYQIVYWGFYAKN